MPHHINHPVRDKIIRNENRLKPILKKEIAYEKLKYQQKNNMYK